jgi:hypothetical protein
MTKLIISLVCFIIVIIFFIVFSIILKTINKYIEGKNQAIEKETYKYYATLELKDNLYLPYYESHGSGIKFSLKSNGDFDEISQVKLDKKYTFFRDNIIYIINNNLHFQKNLIMIDGKQYLVIDDQIKIIEILVSFEKPSHFLVRYNVCKDELGYHIVLKEEEDDKRTN